MRGGERGGGGGDFSYCGYTVYWSSVTVIEKEYSKNDKENKMRHQYQTICVW